MAAASGGHLTGTAPSPLDLVAIRRCHSRQSRQSHKAGAADWSSRHAQEGRPPRTACGFPPRDIIASTKGGRRRLIAFLRSVFGGGMCAFKCCCRRSTRTSSPHRRQSTRRTCRFSSIFGRAAGRARWSLSCRRLLVSGTSIKQVGHVEYISLAIWAAGRSLRFTSRARTDDG